MKYKLEDIAYLVKEKIGLENIGKHNYISTENMLPNKGGVVDAINLPTTARTQSYTCGDVLVSNIRPYFKKIFFANNSGGCSNDVLVFRAKDYICNKFLYYVLSEDAFFEYATLTSKGTKMPRGDKNAIMQYEVPDVKLETQIKIAEFLTNIDDKIALNNAINKNLVA